MKLTPLILIAGLVWAEDANDKGTIYSPMGKRDPFKTPAVGLTRDVASVNPLEKFQVDQFQLRAILQGLGGNKALFEDPEGRTHILSEGDMIGRGKASVSRILRTEVVLTERTFNYLGAEALSERVLSLPENADEIPFLPPVEKPSLPNPVTPTGAPGQQPGASAEPAAGAGGLVSTLQNVVQQQKANVKLMEGQ